MDCMDGMALPCRPCPAVPRNARAEYDNFLRVRLLRCTRLSALQQPQLVTQ
jgi:hypothetical protein